ncbi:unnamed protein product [Thlaspi arvense]|uniref:Uncharacterized protein n=1 Tax=Thlaspi arvense TaxID=13288 RepID=A0AAU9SPV8_THLAR|nr:unnamed protein product [Thlaspi arvense]
MATSTRQASTTVSDGSDSAVEITPAFFCAYYFLWTTICLVFLMTLDGLITLLARKDGCYLEFFAHSVSVSNANVSTADWRIGLVAKSPVSGCKISLHTIQSRLLRGDQVLSELYPSLYGFGPVTSAKTDRPAITLDFKTVVTPGVIGGVVWDYRVEIVVRSKVEFRRGFLTVVCRGIPVIFTADPAGNMIGSLLGSMRRCDYILRERLNLPV